MLLKTLILLLRCSSVRVRTWAGLSYGLGFWIFMASVAANEANSNDALCITGDDLQEMLIAQGEREHVILIDIRSADHFSRGRIERSINMPAYKVKTLQQLKHSRVVLISSGYSPEKDNKLIANLRQKGFQSAYALAGGIRQWQLRGGELKGTKGNRFALNLITAKEFHGSDHENELLFELITDYAITDPFVSGANLVYFDPSGAENMWHEVLAILNAVQAESVRVVVATEFGDAYPHLESTLPDGWRVPVYYLQGGVHSYENFLADLDALRNSKTLTTSKRVGIGFGDVPSVSATANEGFCCD